MCSKWVTQSVFSSSLIWLIRQSGHISQSYKRGCTVPHYTPQCIFLFILCVQLYYTDTFFKNKSSSYHVLQLSVFSDFSRLYSFYCLKPPYSPKLSLTLTYHLILSKSCSFSLGLQLTPTAQATPVVFQLNLKNSTKQVSNRRTRRKSKEIQV